MNEKPMKQDLEAIVQGMAPALRREYDRIRELLAVAGESDARTRHQIGRIILQIKRSEERYGTRAVPTLALALRRNEATLYRYSYVAEAWDEQAFSALLARHTPSGEPLSWSHLSVLAEVHSPADRKELVEMALERGLSVRELTTLAQAKTSREDHVTRAAGVRQLRRLAMRCEAMRARLAIDEALVQALQVEPRSEPAEVLAVVAQALHAQRSLRELVMRNVMSLEALERRLRDAEAQRPRTSVVTIAGGIRRLPLPSVRAPALLASGVSR